MKTNKGWIFGIVAVAITVLAMAMPPRLSAQPTAAQVVQIECERRLKCADAVATRHHRRETECEVNPFPLIEVTVQLPERSQGIC
jgi:hypothetical protein